MKGVARRPDEKTEESAVAHSVKVLLIDANSTDVAEMHAKLADAKSVSFAPCRVEALPEAVTLLRERRFDALLIDLKTPGATTWLDLTKS